MVRWRTRVRSDKGVEWIEIAHCGKVVTIEGFSKGHRGGVYSHARCGCGRYATYRLGTRKRISVDAQRKNG